MDHRKSRKVLKICCIIAVAMILIGWLLSSSPSTDLIGLGIIIAAVVLAIIAALQAYAYMRCPHCEGRLYNGRNAPKPNFCPHCGRPIEW